MIYELEIQIDGRRGHYFAVGDTKEEAVNNTKEVLLRATGIYPVVLEAREVVMVKREF